MILVQTHIMDHDAICARCQVDLRPAIKEADFMRLRRGDRVGLITGLRFTPDAAYRIINHEHDSNKLCVPLRDSIP